MGVSGKKLESTPFRRRRNLVNLMNVAGAAREQVVWYPTVGGGPGFVRVGERGVERFSPVASASCQKTSQTDAEYNREVTVREGGPRTDFLFPVGYVHCVEDTTVAIHRNVPR